MRTLTGQGTANVDTSDPTNYPFGRVKDESAPGANDGTVIEEASSPGGDIYQAIIKLLDRAGITPNELVENDASSQINDALDALYFDKTSGDANTAAIAAIPTPVAVISVNNGAIDETIGALPTYTFTEETFNAAQASRDFSLDITGGSDDYLVLVTQAPSSTSNAVVGTTPNYPYTVHAKHSSGRFAKNTSRNISVVAGTVTGVAASASIPAYFVMTFYKIP